jgi:hypothetical protein
VQFSGEKGGEISDDDKIEIIDGLKKESSKQRERSTTAKKYEPKPRIGQSKFLDMRHILGFLN